VSILLILVRKHPGTPVLTCLDDYYELYQLSLTEPDAFWAKQAKDLLEWDMPFKKVQHGGFKHGDMAWFVGGKLNACVNCLDRHAIKNPDKVALEAEPDDPISGQRRQLTYGALLRDVCKAAQVLRYYGVGKGDVVTIYMPVVAEAVVAMLACCRIGAVHSVVFAGFSATALRDRIVEAQSTVVITTDESRRPGKIFPLKKIVDEALTAGEPTRVTTCLVVSHTGAEVPMLVGRDKSWAEELAKHSGYCPAEPMDAEDGLFLLYTSGSTGKPKGLLHTIGGFLLGAAMNGKYTFDLQPNDKFFCAGDIGWITGHTYGVYMPLLAGIATVMYAGTPLYPDASRYWTIINRLRVTHLYTAPTSVRLLKRQGDTFITAHQPFNSLRVIACVGEPLAPEVWKWAHNVIGQGNVQILDVRSNRYLKEFYPEAAFSIQFRTSPKSLMFLQTYFQTETGSHALTPLAGITPSKPGSSGLPFFGIEAVILDPESGKEITSRAAKGILAFKRPWPSIARTVLGSHQRFIDTYLTPYRGYYVCLSHNHFFYFLTPDPLLLPNSAKTTFSSQATVPRVTRMGITSSLDVSMTWSMYPAIGFLQVK
jgi:acetyl-CoA synthetase